MKALQLSKTHSPKEFFRFVAPSVASMLVFSTYSMVDGLFVAYGVGELALAAVNLCMPFVNGLFALAILMSVGTSTVCAIHLGRGERREADALFTRSVLIVGAAALLVTAACNLFTHDIALFLGATEGTLEYASAYLRIIGSFSFAFMVSYCFEVLVKTGGHPGLAAVGVAVCSVMNIALDYVFVIRFQWGIEGAAYATGIAQTSSLLLFAWHFLSGRSAVRLSLSSLSMRMKGVYRRVVGAGASSFLDEMSLGMTAFLFNRILAAYVGEKGVVAYAVVGYVNTLVLMTTAGITQGMQPIVSLNLGRGNRKACRGYHRYAVVLAAACSLISFAVCRLWPDTIAALLLKRDSPSFAYTAAALGIFSISFLMAGINIVSAGFFAAVERPRFAMSLSLARGFVLSTAALFVTVALWGGNAVWYAPAVSEFLCLTLAVSLTVGYMRQTSRAPALSDAK